MTCTDTGVVPIATTLFAHNFPSITITITIITGAHGIAPLTQLLLIVATKRHPRGTIASFLEFNVRVSKSRPRHTFFRLLLNDSETEKKLSWYGLKLRPVHGPQNAPQTKRRRIALGGHYLSLLFVSRRFAVERKQVDLIWSSLLPF